MQTYNPIRKLNQKVIIKIKIIYFLTNIYFKVNIKNTRKRSEICAKFKIKTLENVNDVVLVF